MVHGLQLEPLSGRPPPEAEPRRDGSADERGVVTVMVAIIMVMAMTFVALVVDSGNGRQYRRQAQAAADGAALAGFQETTLSPLSWPNVVARVESYAQSDYNVSAAAWSGCRDTGALGYQPDSAVDDQCISSDSGSAPTRLRVRIPVRSVPASFAPIFGVASMSVSAGATAHWRQSTLCGLCVLSPSTLPALSAVGNANVLVNNAGIVANAVGGLAAQLVGNARVAAGGAIGGPAAPGGWINLANSSFSPAPINMPPTPDPLAASLALCPGAGTPTPCPTNWNVPSDVTLVGNSSATLGPGIYRTISFGGNANLTLSPGTYIITGGLSSSGNATITAHGVTLYFACTAYPTPCAPGEIGASLNLVGNGRIDVSPPTTGPFAGLSVFFDRNNSSVANTFTGNAGLTFSGTVYMASARLTMVGNASMTVNSILVVSAVAFTGNASITINYDPRSNFALDPFTLSQ
ncbi:MAG: pilus assembly protein TadG-related protein [Acidimicrobiales bacterium]